MRASSSSAFVTRSSSSAAAAARSSEARSSALEVEAPPECAEASLSGSFPPRRVRTASGIPGAPPPGIPAAAPSSPLRAS